MLLLAIVTKYKFGFLICVRFWTYHRQIRNSRQSTENSLTTQKIPGLKSHSNQCCVKVTRTESVAELPVIIIVNILPEILSLNTKDYNYNAQFTEDIVTRTFCCIDSSKTKETCHIDPEKKDLFSPLVCEFFSPISLWNYEDIHNVNTDCFSGG